MDVLARLGLAALLLAAPWGMDFLQPPPASLHRVFDAGEPVVWDGRPFAVPFLEPVEHNASRDATLAGALVCSHSACGPLVWVEGNVSGSRPFLLVPTSATLSREARQVPAPGEPAMASPHGYDFVDFAVAEPFKAQPAMLPAALATALRVAPLAALALLPSGIDAWRRGAVAGAAVVGAAAGFAAATQGLGALLFVFAFGLVLLGSGLAVVGFGVARRRIAFVPLAGFVLGAAFFLALGVAGAYMPSAAWGD